MTDETLDESNFNDEEYCADLGTKSPFKMEELDGSYQKVIKLFSICTDEDPKDCPFTAHVVEALELDNL
ncbi:Lymphokine-activated killer T-cell-originated protein kinase [Sciurus carolinensis]|uniref:Lymphokine-activated killer T-cell-originated protein kinase n=1 Tax=Sciurus carolinensis TaxID=30640 RepID=A0AA41STJ2_SCICA|nr:Lymphokine-activated killer T-cell-originated protein kinase [Sciurus carolinensis]